MDGDARIRGGQVAERAGGAGNKVVAKLQIGDRDGAVCTSSQRDAVFAFDRLFQSSRKFRGAECVRGGDNIGVRVADFRQGQAAALGLCIHIYSGKPIAVALNGVGIRALVVAVRNVEDLIGGVGFAGFRVVYGDAAFACGKGGDAQGKNQKDGQRERHELFQCFHNVFLSFMVFLFLIRYRECVVFSNHAAPFRFRLRRSANAAPPKSSPPDSRNGATPGPPVCGSS